MVVNLIPNNSGNEASKEAEAKALADNILDNFELPESLTKKIDEAEKKDSQEVVEEKEEVEEAPEETSDEEEKEEKEEKSEETEEKEEEEDEELIPKSKFQKRLDEMTREKKLLEMRLKNLEERQNQAPQTKDEDMVKLEQMSEKELTDLKKQVRVSQIKNNSDDAMINKLMELEDKIDAVRATAPQRFASSQIQKFNEAVQLSSATIPEFDKARTEIFQLAKRIYDTAPELQSQVSGQARAWDLATQHYQTLREANQGKTKAAELGRQVNTLKKKVSIDGNGRKASVEPDSEAKLFKKAKNGTANDKLDFIRKRLGTDAQVDSFMESR